MIAKTRCHSSSVTSVVRSDSPGTPAELTRTSTRPSSALDLRDGGVHVGRRRDVAGDRDVALDRLAVEDGDLGAAGPQPRGGRRADPARPAGDECVRPLKS